MFWLSGTPSAGGSRSRERCPIPVKAFDPFLMTAAAGSRSSRERGAAPEARAAGKPEITPNAKMEQMSDQSEREREKGTRSFAWLSVGVQDTEAVVAHLAHLRQVVVTHKGTQCDQIEILHPLQAQRIA